MNIGNLFSLIGGVALFLFGITLMGDGLKKVAGSKLELVLYRLSGTPLKGMLLGVGVTSVIQSSSATSVIVVGFVNSGMMKLRQALSVIQGAIIGTSITGWIICLSSIQGSGSWVSLFSTATITAIVAVIGVILRMFFKKQIHRNIGNIMMGFAVLMYGMQIMSGAVAPLKESPEFINMMTAFSNPAVGILVGTAFTALLQSASASVGILQALSMTGAISFAAAFPIILGIGIGAAVPVLLSALGAKPDGRRTAFSYLIIEILGTVLCGLLYYVPNAFVHFGIESLVMNPVNIAALNTIFRVVTVILLFPFTNLIVKLTKLIIRDDPDKKAVESDLDKLDERFLQHPALAVEQSRLAVNTMATLAKDNIISSISLLNNYTDKGKQAVEDTEDTVDRYEDKLGTYLVKLNTHELSPEQNDNVSKYLHTLSDFERISDHAVNISERAAEMNSKNLVFSGDALNEIQVLSSAISEILELSVSSFIENNLEKAYLVEPLEDRIDILCDEMKLRHVERLQKGTCSITHGFVFNDLMTDFERVADHCSNIAIAIIELDEDCFDTHSYVINLKERHSHEFDKHYAEFVKKYQI